MYDPVRFALPAAACIVRVSLSLIYNKFLLLLGSYYSCKNSSHTTYEKVLTYLYGKLVSKMFEIVKLVKRRCQFSFETVIVTTITRRCILRLKYFLN